MNDDIPWAYVAKIFIAFVSWVYGRLKEAAEIRRALAATKRAAQEARNRAQPAPPPSTYRSPHADIGSRARSHLARDSGSRTGAGRRDRDPEDLSVTL